MLAYYNVLRSIINFIPNFLTLINLSVGVGGIIFAFGPYIEYAGFCILFASVFDYFDGFAARLLNAQSEVGRELDSLADGVTFGVLPGIILYQLLLISQNAYFTPFEERDLSVHLISFVALLIPAGSLFRLAKFNVDTEQSVNFKGIPTPAMAIFIAAIPIMLGVQLEFNYFVPLSDIALQNQIQFRYWDSFDVALSRLLQSTPFLILVSVSFTFLMVSSFPILSLKLKGFGIKANKWKYGFLLLALITILLSFLPDIIWMKGYPFIEYLAIPLIIIELVIVSVIKRIVSP